MELNELHDVTEAGRERVVRLVAENGLIVMAKVADLKKHGIPYGPDGVLMQVLHPSQRSRQSKAAAARAAKAAEKAKLESMSPEEKEAYVQQLRMERAAKRAAQRAAEREELLAQLRAEVRAELGG